MSPSDVLQNIRPALDRAVSFLAADRITLAELCGEPPELTLIASWARSGIRPLEESNVSRNLPWIAAEILAGRPIVLSNLPRGLPSAATEEHAEAEQTGIRAIPTAPVRVAGRVFGALSLTSIAPRTGRRRKSGEFTCSARSSPTLSLSALRRRSRR